MIIASLAFYLFSIIGVISALNVIFQRNPVHCVLWLILTFFNAAGLFVLLGAEFVAMILVVVYVGAVAVLFLFVVMMLDINVAVMREGFMKYLPVGARHRRHPVRSNWRWFTAAGPCRPMPPRCGWCPRRTPIGPRPTPKRWAAVLYNRLRLSV